MSPCFTRRRFLQSSAAAAAAPRPFFPHRHLLGIEGLSPGDIRALLDLSEEAIEVSRQIEKKRTTLRGRTQINLFFEASTRTQSSFELAGKRLGCADESVVAPAVEGAAGFRSKDNSGPRQLLDGRRQLATALVARQGNLPVGGIGAQIGGDVEALLYDRDPTIRHDIGKEESAAGRGEAHAPRRPAQPQDSKGSRVGAEVDGEVESTPTYGT